MLALNAAMLTYGTIQVVTSRTGWVYELQQILGSGNALQQNNRMVFVGRASRSKPPPPRKKSPRVRTPESAMPKLYEYFGLVVFFYANEHDPIHVHGEFQGSQARGEILLKNGKVIRIIFSNVEGRPPLAAAKAPSI